MNSVTHLLESLEGGNPRAAEELLPLVYDQLRQLAGARMAKLPPGQTLQATALVHEAWIRIAGSSQERWEGRGHFFSAAAEAMRRILIEAARRKSTQKRSGSQDHVELQESQIAFAVPSDELLAVHEALDRLADEDTIAADVVKLKYFVGLTIPEIAQALNVAPRTADRYWAYARSWLKCDMKEEFVGRDQG